MIFGNPNQFAIEAVTEGDLCVPSAVWGRMCVHFEAATLGDFTDSHCALYPAYKTLTSVLLNIEHNWEPEFNGVPDERIFSQLFSALWDNDGQVIPDTRKYERYYFLDSQAGEQFYGYFSFVLLKPDGTVCIPYQLKHANFGVANVDMNNFRHAIEQLVFGLIPSLHDFRVRRHNKALDRSR